MVTGELNALSAGASDSSLEVFELSDAGIGIVIVATFPGLAFHSPVSETILGLVVGAGDFLPGTGMQRGGPTLLRDSMAVGAVSWARSWKPG